MRYFRACMQNIFIFQLFLEQNVQFFGHALEIYTIIIKLLKKINKPRLLIVLI